MGKLLLILIIAVSVPTRAQYKVFLKDRDTDRPVQYANIWKENNIVASSDSLGIFYVREADSTATFRVSAVGYETLDSLIDNETLTAVMAAEVIELKNVAVTRPKNNKTFKVGKVKNGDVSIVCSRETLVPMIAKYFPNGGPAQRYLDALKFKAFSSEKNRVIAVAVYSVGANGQPDIPIQAENIICRLKKGHHIAVADFKKQRIPFPPEGVFIVINYLQLEQNKQFGPNNKNWFFYEPSIDALKADTITDSWFFGKNGWQKNEKYTLPFQLQLTD
jgi:hypothetical protein